MEWNTGLATGTSEARLWSPHEHRDLHNKQSSHLWRHCPSHSLVFSFERVVVQNVPFNMSWAQQFYQAEAQKPLGHPVCAALFWEKCSKPATLKTTTILYGDSAITNGDAWYEAYAAKQTRQKYPLQGYGAIYQGSRTLKLNPWRRDG